MKGDSKPSLRWIYSGVQSDWMACCSDVDVLEADDHGFNCQQWCWAFHVTQFSTRQRPSWLKRCTIVIYCAMWNARHDASEVGSPPLLFLHRLCCTLTEKLSTYAHIPRHDRYTEAQAKCEELELQRTGRLETCTKKHYHRHCCGLL